MGLSRPPDLWRSWATTSSLTALQAGRRSFELRRSSGGAAAPRPWIVARASGAASTVRGLLGTPTCWRWRSRSRSQSAPLCSEASSWGTPCWSASTQRLRAEVALVLLVHVDATDVLLMDQRFLIATQRIKEALLKRIDEGRPDDAVGVNAWLLDFLWRCSEGINMRLVPVGPDSEPTLAKCPATAARLFFDLGLQAVEMKSMHGERLRGSRGTSSSLVAPRCVFRTPKRYMPWRLRLLRRA